LVAWSAEGWIDRKAAANLDDHVPPRRIVIIQKSSREIGLQAAPLHVDAHGGFQLSLQLLSGDGMQCAAKARQCSMYSRCSGVVLWSNANLPCITLSLARPGNGIVSPNDFAAIIAVYS
jgi:hypothetical protein